MLFCSLLLKNKFKFTNFTTGPLKRTLKQLNNKEKSKTDFDYCLNLVKSTDYDLYLSTLLLNDFIRPAFAVKAFQIELFSIRTSSQMDVSIAEMKIQFWKDQINKIYNSNDQQQVIKLFEPISNELALLIKSYKVKQSWFNRLIDGRKHLIKNQQQFPSFDELEKCADAVMSPVYYILLNCLNINNIDCDHAASHVSKSIFISGLVRNLLQPNNRSAFYVPIELLIKHGVSQQDLLNISNNRSKPIINNKLKDLTYDLCTRANQHLESARDLSAKIPDNVRLLLAPIIIHSIFLKEIEKCDFDLTNNKLKSNFRVKYIIRLMKTKWNKQF
jgi:phytoene/squalene synthetase